MAKRSQENNSTTTKNSEELPLYLKSSLIPQITEELFLATQRAPRTDYSYSFPLQNLEKSLQNAFSLPDLHLQYASEPEWKESNLVQTMLQQDSYDLLEIGIDGVNETTPLFMRLSSSLYQPLCEALLGNTTSSLGVQDPDFQSSFHSFFYFQLMSSARATIELQPLAVSLKKIVKPEEKQNLIALPSYIYRVNILHKESCIGSAECFLSDPFLQAWTQSRVPSLETQLAIFAKTVTVPVTIELGRTYLHADELQKLALGDLLIIEHPFYKPGTEKTRAFLTIRGRPIFKAKITNSTLKVIDMPLANEAFCYPGGLVEEAKAPIENDPESGLYDESDSLTEEEFAPDDTIEDKTMNQTENNEETSQEINNQNQDIEEGNSQETDFDVDNNPFEGDDPLKTNDTEEPAVTKPLPKHLQAQSQAYFPPEKIDIRAIPHAVIVQLTQLNMTIDELSALGPGNIIDLNITPDDPIALVVDNKMLALGDLVVIGDHIGVRIRKINNT